MARINWNAIDHEEEAIQRDYDEGRITIAEYREEMKQLHREAREEFQEQQRDDYRDEFGGW